MGSWIDDIEIAPTDAAAAARAQGRWNAVAKPIGSLGLLEDAVVRIAALTGSERVDVSRRCVVVLCADNGVVAQGVSQCGQEVTAVVAKSIAQGRSSVCSMATPVGVDCLAVDMGMASPVRDERILDRRIAAGTRDITKEPAMTREEAERAMRVGYDLVGLLKERGYGLIATGEMGIGNTTTATAVACVLLGESPRQMAGRGAGLSDEGLRRKVAAIERALEVNRPDPGDPLGVLACVGGFDIAGLCGMFLGAAALRVPIVIDGYISSVAALCAKLLRPECASAMLPSHLSDELASRRVMDELGLVPPIRAGMRLGEGTGALCLIPLLDMALSLYGGVTFDECGIEPYEVMGS